MNKKIVRNIYRGAGIISILGLGVILAPQKAQAVFGLGDLVADLIQESNSAKQLFQEIQMVLSLKAQFDQAKAQFDHFKAQAMQFKHIRPNWKMLTSPIEGNSTPNLYGETADWSSAASGTGNVSEALRKATIPLHANPNFQNEQVGNSPVSAAIATANIMDGASVAALRTIGVARVNQVRTEQAIRSVETLALSDADSDNTEEASLNIIGAASVQNLRMQQAQQALLVSIAEQNAASNKMWRDMVVENLNTRTAMQQALAKTRSFPGGPTQ